MAVELVRSCDFQGTPAHPAQVMIELKRDNIVLRADVCHDHADVIMETVTFQAVAANTDGKTRDVYTGASGKPFSAAEARAWLVEQGLKSGTATGRVSAEHLDLYARSH